MPDPRNLTVEEAADRLNVSVATIRRWCQTGRLSARKEGKHWVVDASKLPKSSSRRTRTKPPSSAGVDLELSLKQLAGLDLKEVWVPDILRFQDHLTVPEEVLAGATARLDGGTPPDPIEEVEVPKSGFFTRGGALLTVPDRLALHAAVASIVPRLETLLSPSVFSARMSPRPDRLLQNGRDLWVKWKDAVLAEVEAGSKWVIKTDVTAYFDNIQLHLLAGDIDNLNPDPKVSRALKSMLNEWAPMPGAGIPQGPDACRVLGNLYLVPIDQAMASPRWTYLRYLDDIRIAAKTRADAIAGARTLQKECRRRGLFISAQKTELLFDAQVNADLEDAEMTAAKYWFDISVFGEARPILKKLIKRAIKSDGTIVARRARFSLWRLALLRDQFAVGLLLKDLENFAPIGSIAAAYLTPWISRKKVVVGLNSFLSDPERNTSAFLSAWLIAAMLEHPKDAPADWSAYGRTIARDKNQPTYHRVLASSLMARSRDVADVAWLKRELKSEWDPALLRGYAVALARAEALDKGSATRAAVRVPELSKTLAYLQGRQALPSLIYAGEGVPI